MLVSSDYWVTPIRRLNNRRVATPLPVDFASVEYIVSNASIADSAMVQNSLSGYGPIGT